MFGIGGNGAAKPAAAGAGAAAPSTAIVDITDKVDKKGCFLLNGAGSTDCASVLGGVVVHSDAGPQLIFHLPLNETCKITSIQITPANAEETPVLVKLFVNKTAFDFSDAEAGDEVQSAAFAAKLAVKAAKFSAVQAVTIFLDGGDDKDKIGVQRIQIFGTPVMTAKGAPQKC